MGDRGSAGAGRRRVVGCSAQGMGEGAGRPSSCTRLGLGVGRGVGWLLSWGLRLAARGRLRRGLLLLLLLLLLLGLLLLLCEPLLLLVLLHGLELTEVPGAAWGNTQEGFSLLNGRGTTKSWPLTA